MSDQTIEELIARKDELTEQDLIALQQDERAGAQSLAEKVLAERRDAAAPQTLDEYNPRKDPGPPRREDDPALFPYVQTPTDTYEVDLETQRKDETTVLATDVIDAEGHRIL